MKKKKATKKKKDYSKKGYDNPISKISKGLGKMAASLKSAL